MQSDRTAHLDGDENSYDPEYVALKINDFRKVAAPLAPRFTTANRRSNVFVATPGNLDISEGRRQKWQFFRARTHEKFIGRPVRDRSASVIVFGGFLQTNQWRADFSKPSLKNLTENGAFEKLVNVFFLLKMFLFFFWKFCLPNM